MRRTLIIMTAAIALFAGSLPLPADSGEGQSLLTVQSPDGTLAGWKSFHNDPRAKTGDVWKLAGGVLTCKGSPLGYLFTEKTYTDFVLTLEWRSPPGKTPGKGGVLFRMSGKNKVWPRSLEAQLNAGAEGDFWGLDGYELNGPAARHKVVQHAQFGKLTNLSRTKDAVRKPGEWNRYEITAVGGTVTLRINGEEVNRATGCDVVAGPICLTAEGNEIQFRDVRIQTH